MNLADLKNGGFLLSDAAGDDAHAVLARGDDAETRMPWIGRLALGLGAWLAGCSLLVFIMILLDLNEIAAVMIGLLLVVGSVFLLRTKSALFLEQFALAFGFAGYLLVFFGLTELDSNEMVAPFFGALFLCAPVYWFSNHPVQRFFSILWLWVTSWVAVGIWNPDSITSYLVIFGALAVVILLLSGRVAGRLWRPAMWASVVGLFGSLLWISESGARQPLEAVSMVPIGIVCALGMSGLLWVLTKPEGRAAVVFGAAVVLMIGLGCVGAPTIVTSLGLMGVAHARGDRRLGWVATVALAQSLIAFYYHLGIPLVEKSIILMVSGAVLLVIRLVLYWMESRPTLIPEIKTEK